MTFTFQAADIYRGAELIIRDLDWQWAADQHWLLTGPIGSGKTTLAEAIIGRCRTAPGGLQFFDGGAPVSIYALKPHMHYLAFTEDTHKLRFGDVFYYQQRYQAMESDAGLTVVEYLFGKKEPSVPAALAPLNVEPLLDRRFIQLSNGQTRRVRLAKSLMMHPRLLILEEIFTGIDRQTTGIIEQMLVQEAERGTRILLIGDHAPAFITHVLAMDDQRKARTLSREEWEKELHLTAEEPDPEIPAELLTAPENNPDWDFQEAVRFDLVSVQYKDNIVVRNLNWRVRKGAKWMLSGPNGSGKSSLISLIFADNPQAYSQKITLFDRVRGTGESIWDIKRKIGFISPELQTYMRSRRNAVDIAAAGYTNTMVLSRKLKSFEIDRLRALFDYFGIRHLAKKPFMDLSSGEQRLILFIRAVINNPPLLVLDEPFHAMDEHFHQKCLRFLARYCHADRTLIYVSHLQEPRPAFITGELTLG